MIFINKFFQKVDFYLIEASQTVKFQQLLYEGGYLRISLRGGGNLFLCAPFCAQWPRSAKNRIFLQTMDRYTYEKKNQSQKVNLRPKLAHI